MAYTLETFATAAHDILTADPGPAGRDRLRALVEDVLKDDAFIARYLGDDVPERFTTHTDAGLHVMARDEDGERLAERGIVYAPDYVVNAGGIINVAAEHLGWAESEVARRVDATAERLAQVLAHAAALGVANNLAADALARESVAASAAARLAA